MHIELRAISAVHPYPDNPRNNDGAVDAVANSIREFGFRQPIVVDGEGIIVVGHTRWKAAQKLGFTEVPVHVARDLTPEQARSYRIADNRTALIAEWDEDLLSSELAALKAMDVDMSLLGFEDAELNAYLNPAMPEGLADSDAVPEPPKKAKTKLGDLWIMGGHRLICGDSTDIAQVNKLMDGKRAALCATDQSIPR
jgi:ParB-like chromosome segregation protein Spo0J